MTVVITTWLVTVHLLLRVEDLSTLSLTTLSLTTFGLTAVHLPLRRMTNGMQIGGIPSLRDEGYEPQSKSGGRWCHLY